MIALPHFTSRTSRLRRLPLQTFLALSHQRGSLSVAYINVSEKRSSIVPKTRTMMSAAARDKVIQRRQALRQRKQQQKSKEDGKRAKVAAFLTSMDSLQEESLRVSVVAVLDIHTPVLFPRMLHKM